MENILRFAILCRVSTEKQKAKGESLSTQQNQLIKYVELLHGVIPDNCYYIGQEHSTPQAERKILERLLSDADKNIYDAVIVTDASRWSRDNLRSEAGLNILADNGIRFFVSLMEYDLMNPEHRFILGMSTSINQLQAQKQSINSITNRIERAKRNVNSAGRLPFGRTFDKKTGVWGIDPIKQKMIQKAAQRYLSGEGIPQIAATLKLNASWLHRILTKHSGTIKITNFKYKRINETINFNIPALLNEQTIKAIQERIYANKCFRGNIKNKYLLVGYIFCSTCGLRMKSHTNDSGTQYYLHSKNGDGKCKFGKFVNANEIETAILLQLIQTFGDPELMEKAILKAMPDMEKVETLIKEKIDINNELKTVISKKDNIVDLASNGTLSNDEITNRMNPLRKLETAFKQRLNIIESELNNTPDPEHIKKLSQWTGKILHDASKQDPKLIFKKSFDWKRKLIEKAFSGSDSSGKHLGVYMTLVNNVFQYEIRGLLENTVNSLPISDETLINTFNLESEYMDVSSELKLIRNNILSNVSSQDISNLILYSINGTI